MGIDIALMAWIWAFGGIGVTCQLFRLRSRRERGVAVALAVPGLVLTTLALSAIQELNAIPGSWAYAVYLICLFLGGYVANSWRQRARG